MAFHCEKCGTTLSGEYESCPVCAKIEEMMKRIDAGETDVLKNWSSAVAETASEDAPAEAEEVQMQETEAPQAQPADEIEPEQVYSGPIIETEVLSEEIVPDKPEDEYPEYAEEADGDLPELQPEEAGEAAPEREALYQDVDEIREEEDFFPEEDPAEVQQFPAELEGDGEPTGFAELTEAAPAAIPVSYRTLLDISIPSRENAEPDEAAVRDGVAAKAVEEYKIPEKKLGILEQQLADRAAKAGLKPKKKKGSVLFVLVILLLTMILALVTAKFIIQPLLVKRAEEAAAQVYYDYIEGTWLSEYFAFKDRPSETIVELLTVNEDGSFTMKWLKPDMDHSKGWADGTWETTYEISGVVKVIADTQTLLLEYESDGVSYYYERSIVSMNDGEMYLRDYYDDTHTSYYDVLFERVEMPAGESGGE